MLIPQLRQASNVAMLPIFSNFEIFKPLNQKISDLFLIQCKQNYFGGIFPGDETIKQTKGYIILRDIAQSYFYENQYEDFEGYFMEGQYLIQLWAAHLVLEYGKPTEKLKQKCLEEIRKYSKSTLAPKIAEQETNWLEAYGDKNYLT